MASSYMEMPLSMSLLEQEMSCHYSVTYDKKTSTYYDELSTVWESMYKKGLRKQLSCYYNHQPLEQAKEKLVKDEDTRAVKGAKDLARVHHERALDAGKLRKDKGRRWRKKNYGSSLETQSSESSSQSI
ncbi:uncharacterized protein LOC116292748 [Actinia tenebrosa]|uniref:Uncharacterized protein LOC116292748 n=1 Tax=Actinia tenebrosa TaxID=6105 RepID=A0A6P8HLX5_ACTTE|nr:uncharacterized protein LOC116292748 [Actinia tenebrosa]